MPRCFKALEHSLSFFVIMLPSKESKNVDQSPEQLDEKNVPSKTANERPTEGTDQRSTLATERVQVPNREGAIFDQDFNNSSTNIFADPAVAAHYVSVYEKAHYECRYVFDPDLEWTKKEEKRVIRKLDWHGKYF